MKEGTSFMKKQLLFIILPIMFTVGCQKEPGAQLPGPSEGSYTAKLTADNSTLTTDDSTGTIQVEIPSVEDATVKYKFEITAPCYLNTKSSVCNQIGVKSGAMIKSASTYTVEKITIDYFASKGQNFQVFNNTAHTGTPQEPHVTSITPTDPTDGGAVYDFVINSTGWCVYNHTEFNKPSFYYISVIFKK